MFTINRTRDGWHCKAVHFNNVSDCRNVTKRRVKILATEYIFCAEQHFTLVNKRGIVDQLWCLLDLSNQDVCRRRRTSQLRENVYRASFALYLSIYLSIYIYIYMRVCFRQNHSLCMKKCNELLLERSAGIADRTIWYVHRTCMNSS